MKSSLLPLVLTAVVAGLAGGGLAAGLGGDGAPAEAADGSALRAERLERQVQALSDETARLTARLRELELRSVAAAPTPERQPLETSEAPSVQLEQNQLSALKSAIERSGVRSDEELEDRVVAALSRIREAEDAERDERRREQRDEALEDQVKRLTEQLGLDTYQTGRMRDVLTTQADKRDAIFAAARDNGTWADMRQGMDELRTTTRTTLETFLTPTQLEAYDELGPGRGFGGWGRPGRGDGPGGFGPGPGN